jgi:hypothetical protein
MMKSVLRKLGLVRLSIVTIAVAVAGFGVARSFAAAPQPTGIDAGLSRLSSNPGQVSRLLRDYPEVDLSQLRDSNRRDGVRFATSAAEDLDILQILEFRRACGELKVALEEGDRDGGIEHRTLGRLAQSTEATGETVNNFASYFKDIKVGSRDRVALFLKTDCEL